MGDEENTRAPYELTIKAIMDMGMMGKEALFESFAWKGMIIELEKEMQLTKYISLVSKILRMKECSKMTQRVDKGTKSGPNNRIVGTIYPGQNPIQLQMYYQGP